MGHTAALIPAAGLGTRLGRGHKAFVPLRGKTLLNRCLDAFLPHVDEIVVALPTSVHFPLGLSCITQGKLKMIHGGQTRQESVYRLLQSTEASFVLIHDAARPFLSADVIRQLCQASQQTGAATAALPMADTLVRGLNEASPETHQARWSQPVSREDLWTVQTPQAFERTLLLNAHQQALSDQHVTTDDAGLIARLDLPVQLVQGDARLFKITTPTDLLLAEALADVWDQAK